MKPNLILRLVWCALVVQVAVPAAATEIHANGVACTLADAIVAANTDSSAGGCPAGSGADTIVLDANEQVRCGELSVRLGRLVGPSGEAPGALRTPWPGAARGSRLASRDRWSSAPR